MTRINFEKFDKNNKQKYQHKKVSNHKNLFKRFKKEKLTKKNQ